MNWKLILMVLGLAAAIAYADQPMLPRTESYTGSTFVLKGDGNWISAVDPFPVFIPSSFALTVSLDANDRTWIAGMYAYRGRVDDSDGNRVSPMTREQGAALIARPAVGEPNLTTRLLALEAKLAAIEADANGLKAEIAANADGNIVEALASIRALVAGLQAQVAEANDGSTFTDFVSPQADANYRTLATSSGDGKQYYLASGEMGVSADGGRIDLLSVPPNCDANIVRPDANFVCWSATWANAGGIVLPERRTLAGRHGKPLDANAHAILYTYGAQSWCNLKIGVK